MKRTFVIGHLAIQYCPSKNPHINLEWLQRKCPCAKPCKKKPIHCPSPMVEGRMTFGAYIPSLSTMSVKFSMVSQVLANCGHDAYRAHPLCPKTKLGLGRKLTSFLSQLTIENREKWCQTVKKDSLKKLVSRGFIKPQNEHWGLIKPFFGASAFYYSIHSYRLE